MPFQVNSSNCTQLSDGTAAWIAECGRHFELCVAVAKTVPAAELREGFELLFELLRHIDECHDDVVFWADEGGSDEVGVDWRVVLPVYFGSLAATAGPDEYARAAIGVIDDFVRWDRDRHLKAACRAANPPQRKAVGRQVGAGNY